MSDWIEKDGKKYFGEEYLEMANKNCKRLRSKLEVVGRAHQLGMKETKALREELEFLQTRFDNCEEERLKWQRDYWSSLSMRDDAIERADKAHEELEDIKQRIIEWRECWTEGSQQRRLWDMMIDEVGLTQYLIDAILGTSDEKEEDAET